MVALITYFGLNPFGRDTSSMLSIASMSVPPLLLIRSMSISMR